MIAIECQSCRTMISTKLFNECNQAGIDSELIDEVVDEESYVNGHCPYCDELINDVVSDLEYMEVDEEWINKWESEEEIEKSKQEIANHNKEQ